MDIDFAFQPKQRELSDLMEEPGVTNIDYGGSRGGGKSRGGRDVILFRRFKYPRTRALIFRRTFNELWENHIDALFRERPYTRDWYNTQTKTLSLPNGSDIVFAFGEHESDIGKRQGQAYMDIFVDEATKLTEKELDLLRMCRRWTGVPDGLCKLLLTCNPGGVGHSYIKRVFIDRIFKDNEIPESFAFIQAFGWDNVEWARQALSEDGLTAADYYGWTEEQRFEYFIHRTQYGRDLNALPEQLRIQMLLGRWDYFEGQVFPELSEKLHNLDHYFDTSDDEQWSQFTKGLKLIGGFDHATTGISTYGMCGVDVDENLFGLEEYYQADRLISEHAQAIKQLKRGYHPPDYQIIDPSTEAKTLQNKDEMFSVQDAYRREGLLFISAHRASIGVGLDLLKEYLKVDPLHRNPFTQAKGSPRMFISRRRCPNLWAEMSELQCQNDNGRITYIGRDHATDWLRYIAMSRPRAAARREKDISNLPSTEQFVIRTHDAWAKKFDKQLTGGNTYF